MTFSEFKQTEQGKAAQIVFAAALNIHGVNIENEEVEEVSTWIKEANDLDPDPLDTAGAGIVLAKTLAEKTEKVAWDNVVVSKVEQIYNIFIDSTMGGLERVLAAIGVVFQSKRKSLRK